MEQAACGRRAAILRHRPKGEERQLGTVSCRQTAPRAKKPCQWQGLPGQIHAVLFGLADPVTARAPARSDGGLQVAQSRSVAARLDIVPFRRGAVAVKRFIAIGEAAKQANDFTVRARMDQIAAPRLR